MALTKLGSGHTSYPTDYDPSVLETFDNRHPDNDYFVKFNCPEFTSLCPITGQPDYATITISYVPGAKMVESKSLKLYLFSYRNHGDFHENCVNTIMKDLIALMDPKYIEVWGKFLPRGGISIDPYCNYGRPGTRWEQVAWDRLSHHDLSPERVDNRSSTEKDRSICCGPFFEQRPHRRVQMRMHVRSEFTNLLLSNFYKNKTHSSPMCHFCDRSIET